MLSHNFLNTLIKCIAGSLCILAVVSCNQDPINNGEVPEDEISCALAGQNTLDALNEFTNATSENYNELCNAYVAALELQIVACGDSTGAVQAIIDSLGDCEQDTEPTTVVGDWLLTAWNVEEGQDLNNDGQASNNLLDEMDCYTNNTLVLNADNTGVVTNTSYAEFDIEIEVGTTDSYDFTVNCIEELETINVFWSQNGNVVAITDPTSGVSDWILDGDTLSITIPEGFTVINTEDTTISVIQDLTFVYTRQ